MEENLKDTPQKNPTDEKPKRSTGGNKIDGNDKKDIGKGSNGGNGDNNKQNNNIRTILTYVGVALLITVLINVFKPMLGVDNNQKEEITYNEFKDKLANGQVTKVEETSEKIMIYGEYELPDEVKSILLDKGITSDTKTFDEMSMKDITEIYKDDQKSFATLMQEKENIKNRKVYYTGKMQDSNLTNQLYEEYPNVSFKKVIIEQNGVLDFFLQWVLPMIFLYIAFTFILGSVSKKMGGGKGGFMNIGQSNAKIYSEKKTGITFLDVAGQEEAKESLNEIVDFLHHPDKYAEIGARQPKGALLVGPPGTGKTLLAKAVAGEAKVPFFSLSGSDFVEMFVGVGASRVRDLFKQAAEQAPCIIFIDEIDAIGKSRDSQYGGGNDEREQTLNQLLSEMDGFDSSIGVVILGATNRPEILDKALLRPGRFDRRVIVEKPDLKGREDILKVHSKDVKMLENVDLHKIALATSGAVGADLANMVNEAALNAVRNKRDKVAEEDLMEAVEVIIAGKEKKDRIMNESEKRIVAFHEVGHALASALQKHSQPVQKITIVPRTMGSLGYTMNMPEEEKFLMSKDEILDQITVLLAGRAAEEIEFNSITTGASNDIERATKLARSMVTTYGMSEKFDMMALEEAQNRYLDGRHVSIVAPTTEAEIDSEILDIIRSCHKKAIDLLKENIEKLREISDFLIGKENITGEEFMAILNRKEGEELDFSSEKAVIVEISEDGISKENLSNENEGEPLNDRD